MFTRLPSLLRFCGVFPLICDDPEIQQHHEELSIKMHQFHSSALCPPRDNSIYPTMYIHNWLSQHDTSSHIEWTKSQFLDIMMSAFPENTDDSLKTQYHLNAVSLQKEIWTERFDYGVEIGKWVCARNVIDSFVHKNVIRNAVECDKLIGMALYFKYIDDEEYEDDESVSRDNIKFQKFEQFEENIWEEIKDCIEQEEKVNNISKENVYYLWYLAAHPNRKRRGTGSAIIECMIDYIEGDVSIDFSEGNDEEPRGTMFDVYLDCLPSLIGYYQRFGFEVVKLLELDCGLDEYKHIREWAIMRRRGHLKPGVLSPYIES